MILSHRHRFIFIKTRKTAGTSIEIALSRFCGPDDIITRISPADEQVRQTLGYRGAQNFRISPAEYKLDDWKRLLTRLERASFYNHISAARVRARVGEKIWKSYFKFCFERNPWDKVISSYYYVTRSKAVRPSLSDYLTRRSASLSDYSMYADGGGVAIDYIGRYEQLESELKLVAERIGLPSGLELPVTKSGYRTKGKHYREELGEAERGAVARIFAREIDYFGYTF